MKTGFNFKNILFIVPPLIIDEDQLVSGLDIIDQGLSAIADPEVSEAAAVVARV